jgi:hypothetical protein
MLENRIEELKNSPLSQPFPPGEKGVAASLPRGEIERGRRINTTIDLNI